MAVPATAPVFADATPFEVAFVATNLSQPVPELQPQPQTDEPKYEFIGEGVASFYGRKFAGNLTANGERFDPAELTAAHRTLPMGSLVRVTNPANGKSVVVRINDRGPFHGKRLIDLSRAAAEEIGIIRAGHGTVELELQED